MFKKAGVVSLVLFTTLAGSAGVAGAEGISEKMGKGAVKGAVQGAKEQVNVGDVTQGAKQVTKGVLDGAADAAPLITSQIVNQANVNKKAMGKTARTVTGQAVAGAVDSGTSSMVEAIGPDGDGPMANAMVGMTERLTAAIVRGIKAESPDVKLEIPVWTYAVFFALGGLSTFLLFMGMLLLYLAFSRRTALVPAAAPAAAAPPQIPATLQPYPGAT
jgi:hypothetical protein